jgi:hemerythrin-like metal-binding protein
MCPDISSLQITGKDESSGETPRMPLMIWTEKMSVGVEVLDDDHKILVEMLNQLNDGITAGLRRAALEDVIDGMLKHTKVHFAREERFFVQTGFPGGDAHKAEHDLLARRVMNLQSRFENGQPLQLSLEAMNFLKSWLTDHIQGPDMEYRQYLNAQGIK